MFLNIVALGIFGFFACILLAMGLFSLSNTLDGVLSEARWWHMMIFALSLCGCALVVADLVHQF